MALEVIDRCQAPAADGFVVISAKRSTRFIQDALGGREMQLKRGCLESQACTSGVLWVA